MISIQNISKCYFERHSLFRGFRTGAPEQFEPFWALKDVSLEVEPGSVLGIVGPNGSGKSTLLQIVAGILQPTSGRVLSTGRVSALLELGAGFNPEFSGHENVVLSAQLNGVRSDELDGMVREIEEFAELGQFFRRPVKEYSTGMYVRLAFSAAIHGTPEVLIVDEALAVGDARFANRCIQRLDRLRALQTTILFVSHDLGLIKRLCDKAALLWQGRIVSLGTPNEVAKEYERRVQTECAPTVVEALVSGTRAGQSMIRDSLIVNDEGIVAKDFLPGQPLTIRCLVEVGVPSEGIQFGVLIRNRQGIDVYGTNSRIEGVALGPFGEACRFWVSFRFPCNLVRGQYSVTLATQFLDGVRQDWREDCLEFQISDPVDIVGIARLNGSFTIESA